MTRLRNVVLALAVLVAEPASALTPAPGTALRGAGLETVQLVCGPHRCFRRPFWRYGDGRGFFPLRRFGPPPLRRFGSPPFRPFLFRPFRGPPRW